MILHAVSEPILPLTLAQDLVTSARQRWTQRPLLTANTLSYSISDSSAPAKGSRRAKPLSKVVVMDILKSHVKKAGVVMLAFVCVLSTLAYAYAIDNPDAPDYIGEFASREKQYVDKMNDPKNTDRAYLMAYEEYLRFLDGELNAAYKLLMTKLPEAQRETFKKSQRKWLQFRDAEFEFISDNWTRNNFGSSAGISRGAYRSDVVKSRVLQMLQYARNY
jgi:uncharacterized protein YecT (DUF1311 family)